MQEVVWWTLNCCAWEANTVINKQPFVLSIAGQRNHQVEQSFFQVILDFQEFQVMLGGSKSYYNSKFYGLPAEKEYAASCKRLWCYIAQDLCAHSLNFQIPILLSRMGSLNCSYQLIFRVTLYGNYAIHKLLLSWKRLQIHKYSRFN